MEQKIIECPKCFSKKGGAAVCSACGFDESVWRNSYPQPLPYRTKLKHAVKNEYTIGITLGEHGAMGLTYLAWDAKYREKVAIKEFFPPKLALREENSLIIKPQSNCEEHYKKWLDNFSNYEAKTLLKLKHSNIVRIRDFFSANQTAYLVMNYIDGVTLKEYLRERRERANPIKQADALQLMYKILKGVEKVHKIGIIHRDLKPENILITKKNEPIILDFGSARPIISPRKTYAFTPPYAALEQYPEFEDRGEMQGPWTDVNGCAGILYEMITGDRPCDADKRNTDNYINYSNEFSPSVKPKLQQAILNGMRVKHKNRTQSIKEFRNNLKSQPNWIKIAGIIFISSVFVDDIYLRFNIITTVANEIMQQAAYVGISSEFGMVKIRSGDYSIGLDGALSDEQPSLKQHIKSFYLGKHEVTQKEWSKVMGSNPSSSSICDNCPVGNISFDDAQQFIDKLNRLAKENFRIPTEAEWEYACRGGNMAYKYCGSNNPMDVAWYSKNSNDKSHPIEEKLPNGFGLYDMSGNMWEWTCSSYTSKYDGSEKTCDSSQHEHTVRGGGWLNDQEYIRSANRDGISTNKTNPMTGFRLAKD